MSNENTNKADYSIIKQPKPAWLKRRLPSGPAFEKTRRLMAKGSVYTVCQEAQCPNIWECFARHTATFMILGNVCTRDCRFCAVAHGVPEAADPAEPQRVASLVDDMRLKYVTITSVTRDDLPDGGASHFAETIRHIHRTSPDARIEVLIPDFQGDRDALQTVLNARPDVLNHNMETIARLYQKVRPSADYRRSLELLHQAVTLAPDIPTKSGLMLGLGESAEEIREALNDLIAAKCRILTLGQYLQPSKRHLPVVEYVHPGQFEKWRQTALALGFEKVASGPLVRSSYQAEQLLGKTYRL